MAWRARIFPLSTRSFLFVFLLSHLVSRDSACPSTKHSKHGLQSSYTWRRTNIASTLLCGLHRGKHRAACFSRATFWSCAFVYMLRRGSTCPPVFPVSDRQKTAKSTLTSATHARTHSMKTSVAHTQDVSKKKKNLSAHHHKSRCHEITIHFCYTEISSESLFAQRSHSFLGRAAESAVRRPNYFIHIRSKRRPSKQLLIDIVSFTMSSS